jgi:hypothetical protein
MAGAGATPLMREAGVEQMAKMVNSMDASKLREILDDRGIDHTDCPTKVRREVTVKRVVCCVWRVLRCVW